MGRTPRGQTRERIFRFVQERLLAGTPPTVREVQQALGFRAVETARQHLETLVAEGTLAVGTPDEPTALGRIPIDGLDPDGVRILADVSVGESIPPTEMLVPREEHDRRLELAAEVLPWNAGRSPWGNPILIPSAIVGLLYQPCLRSARGKAKPCTGIFGAIEIRNINGPALVDTPYIVHGEVLAMGLSPKTELFWFETVADDESGKRIAEMRMLIRMMKASSPLWTDE